MSPRGYHLDRSRPVEIRPARSGRPAGHCPEAVVKQARSEYGSAWADWATVTAVPAHSPSHVERPREQRVSSRGFAQFSPILKLVSAVSRKTHGTAGTFDIDLPQTGTPGIECRTGGASGNHQVVATFATPVTLSSASVSSGTGSVSSVTVSGNQVFVNLTGIANAQTITITLFGVSDGTNSGNIA